MHHEGVGEEPRVQALRALHVLLVGALRNCEPNGNH